MHPIPIYRAKKIDSDEWVEGYLIPIQDKHYIIKEYEEYTCLSFSHRETSFEERCEFDLIDQKTIAINFPNMLDKNGKKIFASLSEDGVDIILAGDGIRYTVQFYEGACYIIDIDEEKIGNSLDLEYGIYHRELLSEMRNIEVIGIHKGKENAY